MKFGPCVKILSDVRNETKLFDYVMRHQRNMNAERKSVGYVASSSRSKATNALFNLKRKKERSKIVPKKKKRNRLKTDFSIPNVEKVITRTTTNPLKKH